MKEASSDRALLVRLKAAAEALLAIADELNEGIIDDGLLAAVYELRDRTSSVLRRVDIDEASEHGVLYWKWEGMPPGAAVGTPSDVGPAWLIEPDGNERAINGGEWITRDEAEQLAEAGGYLFSAEAEAVPPGAHAA